MVPYLVVKCSHARTQETHSFCSECLHTQETARHKRCFGQGCRSDDSGVYRSGSVVHVQRCTCERVRDVSVGVLSVCSSLLCYGCECMRRFAVAWLSRGSLSSRGGAAPWLAGLGGLPRVCGLVGVCQVWPAACLLAAWRTAWHCASDRLAGIRDGLAIRIRTMCAWTV